MLEELMRLVSDRKGSISSLPAEIIQFIHGIINEADSHLSHIDALLDSNKCDDALNVLKKNTAVFNTYLLISNLNDNAPFLESNKLNGRFDTLTRKFNQTSMRINFELTYQVLDHYRVAIESNNFEKAQILYNNAQTKLQLLTDCYKDAASKGLQNTAAFIDFPQDYSRIHAFFKKLEGQFFDHAVGELLSNAFNYSKTLEQFGQFSLTKKPSDVGLDEDSMDFSYQA